ncbi:MAG: sugar ABC transporter permease [Propionibacteriaceae bacterium]|nr:sugar ABC transporter permease [Propionibacteriaceae bacterium]
MSVRESFFAIPSGVDENGRRFTEEKFVGFYNFTSIFANPEMVNAVWGPMNRLVNAFINTSVFTIVCVSLETVLGVAMALIMARAFRGRGLIRAAILVPWAIPTIVSAMMWKLIFDSAGVANKILGQTVLWLGDGPQSQWAVIIADVWKTAPFIGLLALAGLQTISTDVYEAARVDGANAWQQFTRITLPLVKPALVVAVLFRTLDTLRMFDLPYGLIGPNKYSVETMSMFAYQEARNLRYGPAAAYSIILFLYLVVIAYAFVALLGADVIGDDELKAVSAQRKRQRALNKAQRRSGGPGAATRPPKVRTTITSGESPT